MPKMSASTSAASKALQATGGQKLTMYLFFLKKKDWGEEHKAYMIKKIKLRDANQPVNMAHYFHKIVGNKHPKLFLLWLLEHRCIVLKADNITLT